MSTNKQLGAQGEDLAVMFLLQKNYLILERNYYIQSGEIDIIAQDKEADDIVFVEVKARTNNEYGSPEDAVDEAKRHFLERAAERYLAKKLYPAFQDYRFDLVAVELNMLTRMANIRHVKYI
ncbi:YraN family protein [Candidatus Parcubacteria bacterium]|nr:YraN family protein [Patescibacteria group bacterium]MBU4481841.1 YraN family protein [Patescibacteria group bacterium]MCG2686511.1 YraN family protein [Candidatus Parcubacteria bacterium]